MSAFLNDVVFQSTTSGLSDFTVGAASSGYQTPAAAGAVDATLYSYTARAGTQFESGVGTYSTTGPTLARTTVLDSSTGLGVKVNFSSAPLVVLSPLKADLREKLEADRTYYVATTGNDTTGDGSVANPWLTPQRAWNHIIRLDGGGFRVTVQFANGTYFATSANMLTMSTPTLATVPTVNVFEGSIIFRGNAANKTLVVFDGSTFPGNFFCFQATNNAFIPGGVTFSDITTSNWRGAYVQNGAGTMYVKNPNCVNIVNECFASQKYGAQMYVLGDVTITGNCEHPFIPTYNAELFVYCDTITFSGTVNVTHCVYADVYAYCEWDPTSVVGTPVGKKYTAIRHSEINLFMDGAGASTIPGSLPGNIDNTSSVDGNALVQTDTYQTTFAV